VQLLVALTAVAGGIVLVNRKKTGVGTNPRRLG
jgi:hypothetical protein